jgi:Transposase DDE domain
LKPKTCPSWLTREALAALPKTLVVREVRYPIDRPGFRTRQITLVTTRLDAESYRVADLAELYRQRWQVETLLAQLKTGMQMEVLHGKTVSGTLKELTVLAMVYHLVRLVMRPSATLQHPEVERLSGLDALRWRSAPRPGMPRMPWLVNPARPHRVEPRGKKRHPKSVPCMIKPRPARRQQLVQQELSGSLHVIRPRA